MEPVSPERRREMQDELLTLAGRVALVIQVTPPGVERTSQEDLVQYLLTCIRNLDDGDDVEILRLLEIRADIRLLCEDFIALSQPWKDVERHLIPVSVPNTTTTTS
jgi:hypothetical protein